MKVIGEETLKALEDTFEELKNTLEPYKKTNLDYYLKTLGEVRKMMDEYINPGAEK